MDHVCEVTPTYLIPTSTPRPRPFDLDLQHQSSQHCRGMICTCRDILRAHRLYNMAKKRKKSAIPEKVKDCLKKNKIKKMLRLARRARTTCHVRTFH